MQYKLQGVADVDEEGVPVERDGGPGAVPQRDLQAGRAVGAEHRDDLRVDVQLYNNACMPWRLHLYSTDRSTVRTCMQYNNALFMFMLCSSASGLQRL
jgi:hypothetical protein